MLQLFPGGLGFRTLVRKPLVANQLTCVTLHASYWQLEQFIPYPISPIELVVVLFLFHGLAALKMIFLSKTSCLFKTRLFTFQFYRCFCHCAVEMIFFFHSLTQWALRSISDIKKEQRRFDDSMSSLSS